MQIEIRCSLPFVLVVCFFVFAGRASALEHDSAAFSALNIAARAAYADARAKALTPDQPVFLVTDKITLIKGHDLGSRPTTTPIYETLKSFAHLPLGVVSACVSGLITPNDQGWRQQLDELRRMAQLAQNALMKSSILTPEQMKRQQKILEASLTFIDEILSQSTVDHKKLEEFARNLAPLTLANANDAAQSQLATIDNAVQELKALLTPDEFNRAIAVITGPKTAREGNLQSQYFMFVFGERTMGQRVIYMENVFDRDNALAILRTVLNDRRAGALFYGDQNRLERDLMSDAATYHLMQMFGRLGSSNLGR